MPTNLCLYTQFLSDALDGGLQVDAIYTDFLKAFDKIDHNILLIKLRAYGISGTKLEWFSSYLCDRLQVVRINGIFSQEFFSTSGVPQDSHLGPLLFLIYVNDMKDCFINSEFLTLADDFKLFKIIKSQSCTRELQDDLDRVYL